MNTLKIKDKTIGDGFRTVFMAELNSAFDQNIEEGKRMIKAASEAGSDFLKAEILRSTDIVLNDGSEYTYKFGFNGKQKTEKWYDIIKRKVNSLDFYKEMFEYSRSLGLEFVVSVYDLKSVEFLADMKAAAIKIPTSNINHLPLIQASSESGIPIIFDTGNSYMSEIGRAINWAEKYGAKGIIINHHPGASPAPAEIHNLNIMKTYKKAFGVPVGLSCHYMGDEILYTAIGMGANVLEKPISFNPSKADIDAIFALDIKDLKNVIQKIKSSWMSIGEIHRGYMPERILQQEKGIVANRDLQEGCKINVGNFNFAFPCKGISVEDWSKVAGKRLISSIKNGVPLKWSDVNFD